MTSSTDPVQAAVRATAAWGLPGAPPIQIPDDPPARAELAERLRRTRLLGVMLAAAAAGEVALGTELEVRLVGDQQRALLWCIELELRLLEVRTWFDAAGGIEHLVLKGPAIAHLDALDPAMRTFADIDLLVAGRDVDRAVAVLEGHGAAGLWAPRRPGFDRRFAKSTTRAFPDGVELDLHRTLADGVHGHRIPTDRLFEHPDRLDIGGVSFAALSPVHRLLHAAYHSLLGSREPALMNLRDLAAYLSRPDLDPHAVLPEAHRWQGIAVLAMAVDLVADRLSVEIPAWTEWREGIDLDLSEVTMIARHRHEGSSLGRAKLDVARELPWRARVSYLGALAWPSRAHLASRSLRRRDSLASLMRVIRPN